MPPPLAGIAPPLRHSLRFRLALTFAWFGALVSLLLSLGLILAAHDVNQRLMDETLGAELDDYIARRTRNPASLPPATLSVQGYVHPARGNGERAPPPELLRLAAGKYQRTLDGIPFRVAIAEKNGLRYIMLFNEQRQRQREREFLLYAAGVTAVMTLLSAAVGWWLAGWIVSPLAALARRVGKATPADDPLAIAHGLPQNEIGGLARVFGQYLERMRAFAERERAFTADVSHELRTPLAIVQGAVELLEADTHLDGKQRQRVARIGRAAREMIDMTAALLLMAREDIPIGQVAPSCDVCEVVANAIENHRHLVNGQTLVTLECRQHPRLAAERTLLGIVAANLIRNAFAHTESGRVDIVVTDQRLTVADTGRGIRSEEISRVFQRHFKGAASTGAGIGLSLVKRICERYGWEILIESAEGQGTTAHLTFPAAPPGEAILNVPFTSS